MLQGIRSSWLRYGLSVGLFILTLLISAGLSALSLKINLTILVIFVLVAATWYGGLGAGLLIAILIQITTLILNKMTPDKTIGRVIFDHFSVFALFLFIVVVMSERLKSEKRLREQSELLEVTLSSIGD